MKKKTLILFMILCIFISNTAHADDQIEEEEYKIEDIIETSNSLKEEPILNSRAAVIYDRRTNEILWGKKENERRPMASTTKIMTAIVVLENGNLKDIVQVSKKAAGTGGSRLGLKANDRVSVQDLLYGLLLVSGNDSAVALAEYIAGSVEGFANKMNEKAQELGLENSHFVSPHGLDMKEHYTTAYELAKLTDYALENKKFAEIVNTKYYTVNLGGRTKNLSNTNELLGNLEGVNGVKTGFTNGANRCLVTSVTRNDMSIITVVLGADTKKNRTADSIKLIEYAYQNFKEVKMDEKIKNEFEDWKEKNENNIILNKGFSKKLKLQLDEIEQTHIAIPKEKENTIKVQIDVIPFIEAPVEKKQRIGNLKVIVDSKNKLIIPILSEEEIPRMNVMNYLFRLVRNNVLYMEKVNCDKK